MRITQGKRLLFLVITGILILGMLPLVGCGSDSETTDAVVKVGVMGGQTGPAAASVVAMFEELEHVFEYVNEEEGGIDGIELEWRIIDNKGTPDGSVAAYKELRDGFAPDIYIAVEDYYYLGIKEDIEADGNVLITTSAIDPRCYMPPGRFFTAAIPTADAFAGYAKWIVDNWNGEGQPKIGVLYWDMASGQQWMAAQPWVMGLGVELVPIEYPMTSMDMKPQLLNLRDADVDYIWALCTSPTAAIIVRDMHALDMADSIPLNFNEYVIGEVLLGLAGSDCAGFTIGRAESPYSQNSEAAKLYTRIWDWAGESDKWSDNRLTINLYAVLKAAVKKAANNVGAESIDAEALYQALTELTDIDTMGNCEGFGYGPDRRLGVHTMTIARLTETGTEAIGDPIELPRCFEGIDK